jgi:hypothetical protein
MVMDAVGSAASAIGEALGLIKPTANSCASGQPPLG